MGEIDKTKLEYYEKVLTVMKNNISRIITVFFIYTAVIVFIWIFWVFLGEIIKILFPINQTNKILFLFLNIAVRNFLTMCVVVFILMPFSLGVNKWFREISYNENQIISMNILFEYFENKNLYLKAIRFKVELVLRNLVTYIVGIIPALVVEIIKNHIDYKILNVVGILEILEFVLLVLGLVLAFRHNIKYFMVKYLFFKNEDTDTQKLYERSECIMKKRKTEVLKLYTSFTPFYIVCILIIPVFYVLPFIRIYFWHKSVDFMENILECNV